MNISQIRFSKSRNILCLALLLLCQTLYSSLHFKNFTVLSGLPDNTVKCIAQDRRGFIWMGTFYGLCRFDGVNFTVFTHQPDDSLSIANNHVEALLPVEDGIWVGTKKGVNFYSYEENRFYPCLQSHSMEKEELVGMNRPVKNIVAVGDKIFVLTMTHQLLVWRKDRIFESYGDEAGVSWLAISSYKDTHLLAHTTEGLRLIDAERENTVSRLDFLHPASSDNILYYSENRNRVYAGYGIGSSSEVFTIDEELNIHKLDEPVPSDVKTVVDYGSDTFFGTDGNGLAVLSKSGVNYFSPRNSNIGSDAIHALFVDGDKNLWMGTYRGGVSLYADRYTRFQLLTMAEGQLSHNVVTAVCSRKDKLYIGLDGGGLNVYDKATGRTQVYTAQNSGIAGNNVLSLIADEEYLWLGIYGKGLCRFSFHDRSFKNFPLPRQGGYVTQNSIWKIAEDANGKIWVIGESVCLFDRETETFTTFEALNGMRASGIVVDGNVVWVSSIASGLYKLDRMTGKILKHYWTENKEIPMPINSVRYLFMDSRHGLWFSTEESGLYRLDEQAKTITEYGKQHGLTSRTVTAMAEDASGVLWLGTDNGLFRYAPTTGTFVRFGQEDNLSLFQFNYNAVDMEGDTMFWGAMGGLVSFNPLDIVPENRSIPVCFLGMELLNSHQEISLYGEHPKEIRLPYNQNFFTIRFSAPDLVSPDKVAFSCYMENFEQNWQKLSHYRQVTYTNVPPGEYIFYVKASDDSGQWNQRASSLRIIITPPWWQTGWALTLWIFLALVALLSALWLYRHELQIKYLVRLKETEKNAAKVINEAKLNFFTNITHELRTPVFLITAPLEELLTSCKGGPVQIPKSYLIAMYRNALRLNKLISRIIDFRKLESGKLKLELQHSNVVAFCKDLTVDYEALCRQKNILFYYQPSKTIILLDFDSEKLETILTNLVSNAFKYTPEGGRIIFSVAEEERNVVFQIEDNGIGIPVEYHDVIFDSFFQVDSSRHSAMGDGIGLSFVKHLVELHGGSVKVESRPGQGAKFIFNIPKTDEGEEGGKAEEVPVSVEVAAEVSAQVETSVPQSPVATHTILIIDDERETVEILERSLIEDFRILKAYNGEDGWTLAQESLPDIIICDMMMPKMDGTEFLALLKKDKKLAHIPVIMFTAKTSEEDKLAAFDCGADAYLTKPISLKYLRKRIDHLLARSESVAVMNGIAKTEKTYSKEEQLFLLKCREVIDDNLTNAEFDVAFLAEQLGMGHSTLYRKVKAMTGLSVIEFINDYRIFKAVQYLNEGETNISTVCVRCGFNDLKSFRLAFKRKMQMSPKQYVMSL